MKLQTIIEEWIGEEKPTTSPLHTRDIVTISSTELQLEVNKGYNQALKDLKQRLPELVEAIVGEVENMVKNNKDPYMFPITEQRFLKDLKDLTKQQ